jgi:hypothetical protein
VAEAVNALLRSVAVKQMAVALALIAGTAGVSAATSADPLVGEIAVSIGEVQHFELAEAGVGNSDLAVVVKDPSSGQSVVTVALMSDVNGNRTLRIRNNYRNPIQFDFRICALASKSGCETTVDGFVISAQGEMTQLLRDPAVRVVFYNFSRLKGGGSSLTASNFH